MKWLCLWFGVCSAITGNASVHDGDTLTIKGTSFRLAGLDAEELSEPNGYRARNALIKLIGGNVVSCYPTGEKSHNRMVAICKVNDSDLAADMVRQGYALDCARYSKGRYAPLEPADIRRFLRSKPYC